ncbi:leucine-rich repeat domain-containing protein [Thaumasiovibrio subtropicus]|uniref:leucine-rich repeat domain-containing protein n=1 Tax=Thaumasiovibrio subtropicus TaxID=1891207 RepID=UPI000B35EAE3|nr:hypothetical protein [Thaumasiovibrio subtropicus]
MKKIGIALSAICVAMISGCGSSSGDGKLESKTPPTVNAGEDLRSMSGNTVRLHAIGKDKETKKLVYHWQQTLGPEVAINNPSNPYLSIATPDNLPQTTTLEFEVTVADSHGKTASDRVSLFVEPYVSRMDEVTFVDPELARCINNWLPEGDALSTLERVECGYDYEITRTDDLIYLPNLRVFRSQSEKLASIDTRTVPNLIALILHSSQLEHLDLNVLPELNHLSITRGDKLQSLDVSENATLNQLFIENTAIREIDLSPLSELKQLTLNDSQLKTIDLNANLKLSSIELVGNQLTEIQLAPLADLRYVNLANNQLTQIDVSQNSQIRSLDVHGNQLGLLDIDKLDKIYSLNISDNTQLRHLDVTNNGQLEDLFVSNTAIARLDLSQNPNITLLHLADTKVDGLQFHEAMRLRDLDISNTNLVLERITPRQYLRTLTANNAGITTFSLTDYPYLDTLSLQHNQLATFDVAADRSLFSIDLSHNQLSRFEGHKLSNIRRLFLNQNQLEHVTLPVNKDPNKEARFYLNDNQIAFLEVPDTKVEVLMIARNPLTQLVTTPQSDIALLDMSGTEITDIELGKLFCLFAYDHNLAAEAVQKIKDKHDSPDPFVAFFDEHLDNHFEVCDTALRPKFPDA